MSDYDVMGRIMVHATRNTFRGLVPDRCLQWLTPEQSAANWARNFQPGGSLEQGRALFVAEVESGDVVGLALLGKTRAESLSDPQLAARFPRELLTLHVLPGWQRQGIGRKLVARIASTVHQEGISQLLVRVLVENPNRAFYERLGAKRVGAEPYDWEGYQTREILYGWYNLEALSRPE